MFVNAMLSTLCLSFSVLVFVSGISKFRKIENDDNNRILEFVGIIERAYHDLKGVKMEREIYNTNVVSLIESRLPKNLAINWYRIIHAVDSSR